MHYPPESTSIMFIVQILASILQSKDKENLKKQLLLFCHGTVNEEDAIAHKLLGKEFENQLEMLRDLTAKALPSSEISEVELISYKLLITSIFLTLIFYS